MVGFLAGVGIINGQEKQLAQIGAADLERQPVVQFELAGHMAAISALSFSDDSTWLVSGGRDRILHLWLLKQGRGINVILRGNHSGSIRWQVARGDRGIVNAIAVHKHLLVVGGMGASGSVGEVVVFDWTRNQLLQSLLGHNDEVVDLAFSPDGQHLASIDLSGKCIRWDVAGVTWPSTVICQASERIRTQLEPYAKVGEAVLPLHGTARTESLFRVRLDLPLSRHGDCIVLERMGVEGNQSGARPRLPSWTSSRRRTERR